jgi:putative ABC transport system ATP-binding protein
VAPEAIVFGDEPTGALDSTASDEIMELLADINRAGTTIMLVTHDVRVGSKSERVLFMMDGRIVAEKDLGKYSGNRLECRSREELLSGWLLDIEVRSTHEGALVS